MANNLATRFAAEPLRSVGFSSITPDYIAIGAPFANPARQIYLVNTTDETLLFSLDGVNDHWIIPSGSFLLLDITTNKTDVGGSLMLPQGQRIFVRGPIVTNGGAFLSVFYGSNI